jgi:hypothetical protein
MMHNPTIADFFRRSFFQMVMSVWVVSLIFF